MAKLPFDVGVKASWKMRRRIVISTLIWCGAMVTYLAIWGRDISLSDSVATGCLLLMGSVIGSYVFGAIWDDKVTRETAVQQQAVESGLPPMLPPSATVNVQTNPPAQQGGVE